MNTRALTATRPGPVVLSVDLPAGDVQVITDPSRTVAEVTVTAYGDTPAALDAVRNAVLRWHEPTGTLTVRVRPAAGGAHVPGPSQTVIGNRAATIVLGDVRGDVTVIGNGVIVNGVEITGGAVTTSGRVQVTAHLPEGSSVEALTQSAPLNCSGEFADVEFTTTSGDLSVGSVGALRARTTSGDVFAAVVNGSVRVRSVSGDVYIGSADDVQAVTTSGDVTVNDFSGHADLHTVSGDVRVRAIQGGAITARSVSGDVTVTATGTALGDGLTINAASRAGRVMTPAGSPAGTASRPHQHRAAQGEGWVI